MDLKAHIRSVPDFPKQGVLFYDISTLLANAGAWRYAVDAMAARLRPYQADMLVGIESRGFLMAAPLAVALGLGFIMVRKPAKLPGPVVRHDYTLEYGSDALELQVGAVLPQQRVIIVDDLLATGGTIAAASSLVGAQGAEVVALAFLIELTFLGGRDRLRHPVETLLSYDS